MTIDSAAAPARALPAQRRTALGRVAGAQASAALAQVLGALQLVLLLHAGSGRASDSYFVVFAAGQLVISTWVLGVVYPRHLSDPTLPWRGRSVSAATTAAACCVVAGAYLVAVGYAVRTVLPVTGLLTVAAAAAAAANCQAAVLACTGAPRPLAGVALLPNLSAVIGLLAPHSLGSAVVRMCVGLAVGNVVLLPLQAGRVRRALADQSPAAGTASPLPRWLVYAAVIGNLAPLVLQGALASLAGGQVSAFSAASRLTLAATTVGVSSILPLLVSWNRYEAATIRRLCRLALALLPAAAAVAAVLGALWGRGLFTTPVLAMFACWALVAPTTPLLTQATIRHADFTAFRTTGSLNLLLTIAGAVATVVTGELGVAVATALAVQGSVTTALLHRLGWDTEVRALAPIIVGCGLVVVVPVLAPVGLGLSALLVRKALVEVPA